MGYSDSREVLDIVQSHDSAPAPKRRRSRPRRTPIIKSDEEEDRESIADLSVASESELEETVARRARSHRIN